ETRRIVGDFILSVEDLVLDRDFEDCIGYSMYGWDLPDPENPGVQPFANDTLTGYQYKVKKGLSTPLPYRIMLPRPVKNLICPGRGVSVEGQVLGPVRVMAPCMAMGEAAGMASAQVVQKRVSYANVDIGLLRGKLKKVNAIVDKDQLPDIYPRVDQF
ncbi:MAG: FAD-dependent oxidoreductase, partial [Cyclobacteriaceae bacterium]